MWERYRGPLDTTSSSRTGTAASLLVLLFILLFVVFTYTILHEAGHALVGLLSGGRLTSFSIDIQTLATLKFSAAGPAAAGAPPAAAPALAN